MKTTNILNVILGILVSLSLGLASFSLKWVFDANAQISVMNETIRHLKEDQSREMSQDNQIRMFWIYNKWLHHQVNLLNQHEGIPIPQSPDFR